jgi:hypothetical protein
VADSVTLQVRGQSYLIEVIGRAGSTADAIRLTNTFAGAALLQQDALVQEAAGRASTDLSTQLTLPDVSIDDMRQRIAALDSVEQNGDPTLDLATQSETAVRAGLPRLTMTGLGGLFGLMLAIVSIYAWSLRKGQPHPSTATPVTPRRPLT